MPTGRWTYIQPVPSWARPTRCANKKTGKYKHKRLANGEKRRGEHLKRIERQSGECAICLERPPRLVLDHDHKTGMVRGMLCHKCNVALGLLQDDKDVLVRAIAYMDGGYEAVKMIGPGA